MNSFEMSLPDDVKRLVKALREAHLKTVEAWLFGSRARGDHHENSDYDILAVMSDDMNEDLLHPVHLFRMGRKHVDESIVDLFGVRKSEFDEAKHCVNTLCHAAWTVGFRIL